MKISRNMLYATTGLDDEPVIRRVLEVYKKEGKAVVFDIVDKNAWPVWIDLSELEETFTSGAVQALSTDPYAHLIRRESDFGEAALKKRNDAWDCIGELVTRSDGAQYTKKTRNSLISDIIKRTKISRITIYKDLRRYWQRGQIKNALIADYENCGSNSQASDDQKKRGRKSKLKQMELEQGGETDQAADPALTEEDRQNFAGGIKEFYLGQPSNSLEDAYQRTLEKYYSALDYKDGKLVQDIKPPGQRPSKFQFKYFYYQTRDPVNEKIKREGQRAYYSKYRPIMKDSVQFASGPLSVGQIDATIGDIYLVSSLNRAWVVGRPVIYSLIDVFSDLICGFHVGLEHPSWSAASMAVVNMTSDKEELCRRYGVEYIPSQWPCKNYLFKRIVADGGEFESKHSEPLTNSFGVELTTTAAYRGDDKGLVERKFRTYNDELISKLPGSVKKKERGDADYRLKACLTLQEFRRLFIMYVIYHNNARRMNYYPLGADLVAAGVEPYPTQIWNWGIEHRTGLPAQYDPELVRINLLPGGTAAVKREGIQFKGLFYKCDLALDQEWFSKAKIDGSWPVDVIFDPEKASEIYLPMNSGKEIVTCTLIDKTAMQPFFNCDWYEVQAEFKRRAINKQTAEPQDRNEQAALQNNIESIVSVAEALTKEAAKGVSKRERLANMNERRRKEQKRSKDGTQPDQEAIQNWDELDNAEFQEDGSVYIAPHNPLDKMREGRNQRTN